MSGDNDMSDWLDDEVKRKMKRRKWSDPRRGCAAASIVVFVLGVLLLFGVIFVPLIGWSFNSLQGMGDTANEFMLALRDGDYNAAFALMSDSFQQEVGHSENLVARLGGRPQDWSFNSFNSTNNFGTISGTAQLEGNSRGIVINLINDGSGWRIVSVFY